MEYVGALFGQLAVQLPLFAVYLVGLVLAIGRWQQHPRVSQLVVIALALLIVDLIAGTFTVLLPSLLMTSYGWGATQMGVVFAIIGVIRSAITAVAFGLLLWAVFGWRKQGTPVSLS